MSEFFGFAEELIDKGRAQIGNTYANAELYDLLVQGDWDVDFYLQIAKKRGGRVLDVACGTGRILPFLLDAGLEVVALDLAPEMLTRAQARLRSRASAVEFVLGDMREFRFDQAFDTILIPYRSFMYMHSDEDRLKVLANCYEHLEPGGYLAFDFPAGIVELGEGVPALAMQGIHPFTEELLLSVVQLNGVATDLRILNQINYTLPKGGQTPLITVYSSKEAVLLPGRVRKLLLAVGFRVEGVYGNHHYQEYAEEEECIIVAQKMVGQR